MMTQSPEERREMLDWLEGQDLQTAWQTCDRSDWMLRMLMHCEVSDTQWYKIGWRLAVDTQVLNQIKTSRLLSDGVRVAMYALFDLLAGTATRSELDKLWSKHWSSPHAESFAEQYAKQSAISLLGSGRVSEKVLATAEFAAKAAARYIRWQGMTIKDAHWNMAALKEDVQTYRLEQGQAAYRKAMKQQAYLIREMLPELPL